MLVKNWMSKKVITADIDDSMQNLERIIRENKVRRLPVMDNGKLVGIITGRDMRSASASKATSLKVGELAYSMKHTKASEVMTRDPIAVPFDYTIEETAAVFLDNRISGAPVVSAKGELVGIITQTDIFRALISLTGVWERGLHLAMEIEDSPGSIRNIADVVREEGGRLVSILTAYDRAPRGYRNVYLRAYGVDRNRFSSLVKQLWDNGRLLYIIDHDQDRREIY